jgi:hypothetical protein
VARGSSAPRGPGRAGGGGPGVLRLQRAAGNRAVTGLVKVVQRHSSWEHALLGDTDPRQLGNAAVSAGTRKHVVAGEWERMKFFQEDPYRDPTTRFPDVRWIKLKASGLWVSNGELNALGDYLPDPTAYDTLPANQMIPVLQKMRGMVMGAAGKEFGLRDDSMKGEASGSRLPGAAGEVKDLDNATAQLGSNRYAGLVARNACHFAPFSWQRWALYHTEATEEARQHFDAGRAITPLRVVDTNAPEHQRQAMLKNGLRRPLPAGLVRRRPPGQQDAGHAVVRGLPARAVLVGRAVAGGAVRRRAEAGRQRAAARHRRPRPVRQATHHPRQRHGPVDRHRGRRPADRAGTLPAGGPREGSGVSGTGKEREANYQAYLTMLNSAFMQLAAGAAHDWFNEKGLLVENGNGDRMAVGGDDTMLSKSGPLGAQLAGTAAAKSRLAIDELMRTGTTQWTIEQIFGYVPQRVVILQPKGGEHVLSLADFQNDVVHQLCTTLLFPQLVGLLPGWEGDKADLVRYLGSEMVKGGVQSNQKPPVGDYPVPANTPGRG